VWVGFGIRRRQVIGNAEFEHEMDDSSDARLDLVPVTRPKVLLKSNTLEMYRLLYLGYVQKVKVYIILILSKKY
jgi:hypothetical protein